MRRSALLLAALAALAALPSAADARGRHEALSGTDYVPVPCSPAGADYYDPATGRFSCAGTSTWTGSLTGETLYHSVGTADLATGDQRGITDIQLVAVTADGHHGTLHLVGELVTDGATGVTTITTHIVDGGGDFAHAKGAIVIAGPTIGPGSGILTYAGRWTLPSYRAG
jgi:hypothetical protein